MPLEPDVLAAVNKAREERGDPPVEGEGPDFYEPVGVDDLALLDRIGDETFKAPGGPKPAKPAKRKPEPRRSGLPSTWSEAYERISYVVGDEHAGHAWVEEALERKWGVRDPTALDRTHRKVALQKVSGVVLAIEELGHDLAFALDGRATIARTFARYFDGLVLDGPPWKCSPLESGPSYDEWASGDDFD